MKIIIGRKEEKGHHIIIPTGMLLNRVTAGILPGALEKKGIILKRGQIVRLIQAIRVCRRQHPEWKIVDLESSDGDHVEVYL